jgi:hypothetical protein
MCYLVRYYSGLFADNRHELDFSVRGEDQAHAQVHGRMLSKKEYNIYI